MTPLTSVLSFSLRAQGQIMKADLFISNSLNSQVKTLIATICTEGQRQKLLRSINLEISVQYTFQRSYCCSLGDKMWSTFLFFIFFYKTQQIRYCYCKSTHFSQYHQNKIRTSPLSTASLTDWYGQQLLNCMMLWLAHWKPLKSACSLIPIESQNNHSPNVAI